MLEGLQKVRTDMSLADEIREMDDEDLAEFLVWGVPDECDDCPDFAGGCALKCEHDRRTQRMLDIITEED
jgi:hypothetical protein